MLKFKILLLISLCSTFFLINILADVMHKEDTTISNVQVSTPYGTIYNK